MKMIITILFLVIVAAGGYWYVSQIGTGVDSPAATTTPEITTTGDPFGGQYINAKEGDVVVDKPLVGATVSSEFEVTGTAKGWYFEASFPVELRDADNNVIAQVPAQAQGDWMTSDPVPFKATLKVTNGYQGAAVLILMKDNPSGLPENEAMYLMPLIVQ